MENTKLNKLITTNLTSDMKQFLKKNEILEKEMNNFRNSGNIIKKMEYERNGRYLRERDQIV
jgi:hypothetical protein